MYQSKRKFISEQQRLLFHSVSRYFSFDPNILEEKEMIIAEEKKFVDIIKNTIDSYLDEEFHDVYMERKHISTSLSFYFSETQFDNIIEEMKFANKKRAKGRCVGCQNHRGLIKVIENLMKIGPQDDSSLKAKKQQMKSEFDDFFARNNFSKRAFENSLHWTTLENFNILLIGFGNLITKFFPEIENPYFYMGTQVYKYWELINFLIDGLRITKDPGDIYDKFDTYTKMFNNMRSICAVNVKKGSNHRIMRNKLIPGIDAATEDPSYRYILGIMCSVPEIIWGLRPAWLTRPEIMEHDVQTFLNQNVVLPRHHIRSYYDARGRLIIGEGDQAEIYGQIVELESEEIEIIVDDDGNVFKETAYLGKIKGPVSSDEVDFDALVKGEMQFDERQLAVLITKNFSIVKDIEYDKNIEILKKSSDFSMIQSILGLKKFVLEKGQVFNAPYHITQIAYQSPSVFDRFVQLIHASREFGDFEKVPGIWKKIFRLVFNKKVIGLIMILTKTINRIINKTVSVMEQEIVHANNNARVKLEQDDTTEILRNEERRMQRERIIREELNAQANDRINKGTISTLAGVVEERDPCTGGHIERVSYYSIELAKMLNYDKDDINQLFLAGAVHDLGKISTPESILNKPGPLDLQERKIMEQHVEEGIKIMHKSELYELEVISDIFGDHHEAPDGSGYPKGKKEHEIEPLANCIRLPDIWDALISERPYKKAMDPKKALQIMIEEMYQHPEGNKLAPRKFVEAFIKLVDPDYLKEHTNCLDRPT